MKIPDTKFLVESARRAVCKMEMEYRRLHADAVPGENWSEGEELEEALEDFEEIYPA